MGVSSLVLFMNSLEFCNAVVQVAHPLVRSQLLDYLHNGFLIPVMGPALHKVGKGWVAETRSRLVWIITGLEKLCELICFLDFNR